MIFDFPPQACRKLCESLSLSKVNGVVLFDQHLRHFAPALRFVKIYSKALRFCISLSRFSIFSCVSLIPSAPCSRRAKNPFETSLAREVAFVFLVPSQLACYAASLLPCPQYWCNRYSYGTTLSLVQFGLHPRCPGGR